MAVQEDGIVQLHVKPVVSASTPAGHFHYQMESKELVDGQQMQIHSRDARKMWSVQIVPLHVAFVDGSS